MGSFRLHPARRTFIPLHMQVLLCRPLAYQDLRYCCNQRGIDLLSVPTPEDLPLKFLCPLRKPIPLVALLHHLHSEEDHHRLLYLMNLAICLLTPLLRPWRSIVQRTIARRTTVVVIIHLENRLVDLLVKASSCSIPYHRNRHLTTLEILLTPTIITTRISIVALVRNRDQCRQLPTAAVRVLLRSNLTQLVNLLDLHNPARLPLSAPRVCMSKTILPSKRVVGTDGLLQVTTVNGIVVRGIAVTMYPTLLSPSLSIHERIALVNLLLDHTRRIVTGMASLL